MGTTCLMWRDYPSLQYFVSLFRSWSFVLGFVCTPCGLSLWTSLGFSLFLPMDRSLWTVHNFLQSGFSWECYLVLPFSTTGPSLSLTSSFLCLLLPLLLPFIFPSVTCFRRQFLRNMCPVQLTFCSIPVCRIFLISLTLCNISALGTWSVQVISILPQHHISKTFPIYFSDWLSFSTTQNCTPNVAFSWFLP